MPINRGMDKEDVVHTYSGILLSHKKEQNCAVCRDMGEPRDCHIEWLKLTFTASVKMFNYYCLCMIL